MDLRKELDLDNKYSTTRKNIKNIGKSIKKHDWSFLKKILLIAVPIILFYIINIALGGIFETRQETVKEVILPEASAISVKLDDYLDPDTDGLTTKEETELGTNPFNRDTDGDGVTDDGEVSLGLNPLEADKDILIEAYKGLNGIKYSIPVNIDSFVVRASDLNSRAYMSVSQDTLPNGMPEYTFNVTGKIEGEGYYERKDGLFEKRVSGEGSVKVRVDISSDEMRNTSPVDCTTLKVFGNNMLIENTFLRGILNFLLPKHGAIAAFDNLRSDYSPNAIIKNNIFDASNMDFAQEVIENLQDNRFNLLHIDTSYKDRLKQRIDLGEIVPASIISNDREYLLFITGYYSNGNFLAVDAKTRKEIGEIEIKKTAKPITDGQSLVQIESLTFKLGDLSSDKGDRLIFL